MPGVCYSALRRLPRQDLHLLENNGVEQTFDCLLCLDAPCRDSIESTRICSENTSSRRTRIDLVSLDNPLGLDITDPAARDASGRRIS
jgi:hypothetical protein